MGGQAKVGTEATADPGGGARVLLAACDGACSGNPGPGGWGALLRFEDGALREWGGHDPATTNNRMELTAALEVLRALRSLPRHPQLVILTDSRYLIDGLQKWMPGWKRKGWRTAGGGPVLNRDLWEQLDGARLEGVALRHVRGHSGHPENDRCDAIAVAYSRGERPRLAGAPPMAAGAGLRATGSSGAHLGARAGGDTDARVGSPPATGPVQQTIRSEAARSNANTAGTARGVATATPEDPAPPGLLRLLSRLELADRLAAGGHGLTVVELAQLVEQPLAQLERRQGRWRWRDWSVEPIGQGRWRLRRADGGWADEE
ncbi:MAG: ribonuclease H [Cyanobacteriota bacterium]|jgi:ribonuclease HI